MTNHKPKRDEAKTHCLHGHPLSGENLYVVKTGQKTCKTCRRLRNEKLRKKVLRNKNTEGLF